MTLIIPTPPVIIDKLAWMPRQNRRVLFARSRGQTLYFNVGGKRMPGESDHEALIREVVEETSVALVPFTITHLHTFEEVFAEPRFNYPAGTLLRMACYDALHEGILAPSGEVEELRWFSSTDGHLTTPSGRTILAWFKDLGLID